MTKKFFRTAAALVILALPAALIQAQNLPPPPAPTVAGAVAAITEDLGQIYDRHGYDSAPDSHPQVQVLSEIALRLEKLPALDRERRAVCGEPLPAQTEQPVDRLRRLTAEARLLTRKVRDPEGRKRLIRHLGDLDRAVGDFIY